MSLVKILKNLYTLSLRDVFQKIGIDEKIRGEYHNNQNKTRLLDRPLNTPVSQREEGTEVVRYIHVGSPKSASTALQQGFFGIHGDLLHLGCGKRVDKGYWDDHGYISKEVNTALEIDIRYKSSFAYEPEKTKQIFEDFFRLAEADKTRHAVGISNENLAFNWHGGVDVAEKAKRLHYIFGEKTKIIMVCRNQKSLIESLYQETVRFGYAGSFEEYLKYLWQYKDRNFLYEFCYDNIYKLYSEFFGKQNVKMFFFESFKENQSNFLKELSQHIGVSDYIDAVNKQFNSQLSKKALAIKLELNKKIPHSFEMGNMHPFDTHRYVNYFTNELGEKGFGNENYLDYYLRDSLCGLSEKLSGLYDIEELTLSWDNKYGEAILELYKKSNEQFYKQEANKGLLKYDYLSL